MTNATPLFNLPFSRSGPLVTDARHEFSSLEDWLSAPSTRQLPLHHIECQQEPRGREVQRLLLQAHIQQRGYGDVGPALRVVQGSASVVFSHRRLHTRLLKTIFGLVHITRMSYSHPGAASTH